MSFLKFFFLFHPLNANAMGSGRELECTSQGVVVALLVVVDFCRLF
jgi:hypothetical protein